MRLQHQPKRPNDKLASGKRRTDRFNGENWGVVHKFQTRGSVRATDSAYRGARFGCFNTLLDNVNQGKCCRNRNKIHLKMTTGVVRKLMAKVKMYASVKDK